MFNKHCNIFLQQHGRIMYRYENKKYNKDQVLYMRDIHPHSITAHSTQEKVWKDESHISKSRKIHLLLLLL